MQKRNIRIIRAGLTVGSTIYKVGDIVPPLAQTHDLQALAGGKLLVGERWAEWVDGEVPAEPQHRAMTESVTPAEIATQVEEVASVVAPEVPAVEPEAVAEAVATTDLAAAILAGVEAGKGKTALVKELALQPGVSQRQVGEKFDELLAIGKIIAGAEAGQYSVA